MSAVVKPPLLIIWYAAILHAAWGLLLLLSPLPVLTTPIHALFLIFGDTTSLGTLLLVVSAFSVIGLVLPSARYDVLFVFPQQMVLLVSAGGAFLQVLAGQYADGVPRAWSFILADQLPGILAALIHTIALLRWTWQRSHR